MYNADCMHLPQDRRHAPAGRLLAEIDLFELYWRRRFLREGEIKPNNMEVTKQRQQASSETPGDACHQQCGLL